MYSNAPTTSTEVLWLREVHSHWYCALALKNPLSFVEFWALISVIQKKKAKVGVYPEPRFPHS
jgi:hypothetical protein